MEARDHKPQTHGGPGAAVGTPPVEAAAASSVPAAGSADDGGASQVAELASALAAARAEAAENYDKFLRERAEMENYKRRLERNYADQAKRGRKDLLLRTLNVLDNLERAISYHSASGTELDVKNLIKGLQLTHAQFRDVLVGEGLQEIKAVGEHFDPARHEAVATETTADAEEGQIVAEVQKGYLLDDELLRPARVKVATRQ